MANKQNPLEFSGGRLDLRLKERIEGMRSENVLVVLTAAKDRRLHLVMEDGTVWRAYRLKGKMNTIQKPAESTGAGSAQSRKAKATR